VTIRLIQTYRATDSIVDWLARLVGIIAEIEEWRELTPTSTPPLINSWDNVGGALTTAAFYIDPYQIVRLKGSVDTGASGTVAFVLPVGYRPPAQMTFTAQNIGGGPGPGGTSYITIAANGNVTLTVSGAGDISMDAVSFRAL